jgi:hypothetical protein
MEFPIPIPSDDEGEDSSETNSNYQTPASSPRSYHYHTPSASPPNSPTADSRPRRAVTFVEPKTTKVHVPSFLLNGPPVAVVVPVSSEDESENGSETNSTAPTANSRPHRSVTSSAATRGKGILSDDGMQAPPRSGKQRATETKPSRGGIFIREPNSASQAPGAHSSDSDNEAPNSFQPRARPHGEGTSASASSAATSGTKVQSRAAPKGILKNVRAVADSAFDPFPKSPEPLTLDRFLNIKAKNPRRAVEETKAGDQAATDRNT